MSSWAASCFCLLSPFCIESFFFFFTCLYLQSCIHTKRHVLNTSQSPQAWTWPRSLPLPVGVPGRWAVYLRAEAPQAPPVSPCVVLWCVPACVVCAGPPIICPRAANCLPSHHDVFTLALSAPVQFWSLPLSSWVKSGPRTPSTESTKQREGGPCQKYRGELGGSECFRNLFRKLFSFLLCIYRF